MKTQSERRHTPTPWAYVKEWSQPKLIQAGTGIANPHEIGQIDCDENAAFIVKCVNAHEELLETLKGVKEWLRSKSVIETEGNNWAGFAHWQDVLEQAIAKAQGK